MAGALFALGVLVWVLANDDGDPPLAGSPAVAAGEPARRAAGPSPGTPPSGSPAAIPRATPGAVPRIATRDEFIQALDARGLDGEKLLAAYQDWRVARGYLGADPLTGITPDDAPAQVYAAMDRATQKSLADSGDLGAIQAYAAGSLPAEPATALEYFGRASRLGSAAAMASIAAMLAQTDGLAADARADAAAWILTAIRLHGPLVATPDNLALLGDLESSADTAAVATACGRSLAILADLSATSAGANGRQLPPAFIAEKDLYTRLPCRDTPAPVMPPRDLERCTPSPAVGSGSRPVELWICAES